MGVTSKCTFSLTTKDPLQAGWPRSLWMCKPNKRAFSHALQIRPGGLAAFLVDVTAKYTLLHALQIRPGGLAAFPVDVTALADGMAIEEEGLAIVVEVARGARPSAAQAEELAAFVRSTVGFFIHFRVSRVAGVEEQLCVWFALHRSCSPIRVVRVQELAVSVRS